MFLFKYAKTSDLSRHAGIASFLYVSICTYMYIHIILLLIHQQLPSDMDVPYPVINLMMYHSYVIKYHVISAYIITWHHIASDHLSSLSRILIYQQILSFPWPNLLNGVIRLPFQSLKNRVARYDCNQGLKILSCKIPLLSSPNSLNASLKWTPILKGI